jgi:hypothetical protein
MRSNKLGAANVRPASPFPAGLPRRACLCHHEQDGVLAADSHLAGERGQHDRLFVRTRSPLEAGERGTLTTDSARLIVMAEATVEEAIGASWYIVHRGHDWHRTPLNG